MRFSLVFLAFLLFGLNFAEAQKFGYIDASLILSKMREYQKAQSEIEQLTSGWQKEVEGLQREVEMAYMQSSSRTNIWMRKWSTTPNLQSTPLK